MNKITSFFNNNSILFFSWYCTLLGFIFVLFDSILTYDLNLTIVLYYFRLLVTFIMISIFYSFYQSIRNIKINKKYAFALLIFYLVAWMFFSYDLINDGVNEISVTKFSIFILIHVCFCLYNLFKKKDITLIIYLMFYGSNSFLLYFLIKHIK